MAQPETGDKEHGKEPVISPAMLPASGMLEVGGRDGERYLLQNDVMFTGMQHSRAEFSRFFLALRDESRIFGHRCPACRTLEIPPFETRCAACNFTAMQREYVRDTGVLAASPVITIFAPSRFKQEVPFATGRVYLESAEGSLTDTAMLLRARTTHGAVRPGIFSRGTPVKAVFRAERVGGILDLFLVPQSELTPAQLTKSPLFENDLKWDVVQPASFDAPTPESQQQVREILTEFSTLARMIKRSPRASANLANWNRAVAVRTAGGDIGLLVRGGGLEVATQVPEPADLVLTLTDPSVLLGWLRAATGSAGKSGGAEAGSAALTDLVIEGTIWLSKSELETVTRLDRIPRSLRRDGVAS
jgi:uncharacterized OB-fold protein